MEKVKHQIGQVCGPIHCFQIQRDLSFIERKPGFHAHIFGFLVAGNRHIDAASLFGPVVRHHGVLGIECNRYCNGAPDDGGPRKNQQEPEPGLAVPGCYGCFSSHKSMSHSSGQCCAIYDQRVGPTNRLSVSRLSEESVSDCALNRMSLLDSVMDSGGTSTTVGNERFSPLSTITEVSVRIWIPSRPLTDSVKVWGTSVMLAIFSV